MHFTSAIVLAAACLAAAQSSSTSSPVAAAAPSSSASASGCGSQIDITIASCLKTTNGPLNACATNDWRCYCTAQKSVLTCYDNCPSDPNRVAAEQNLQSWCNAAKVQPESSTTSYSQAKTTAGGTSTSGTATTTGGNNGPHTGFAQASGSASASAGASSSSGAAYAIAPAGGLAAAILGGLALF